MTRKPLSQPPEFNAALLGKVSMTEQERMALRKWVNAFRSSLNHVAEIASTASEANEGNDACLVFDAARKALMELSDTNPEIKAVFRLGLPN